MRIRNSRILILLIILGCQQNNITPKVDCLQSDLNFVGNITNTECGLNTGKLEINASGGEPPYSYSLAGGNAQESPTFSNLGAGEYQIKVIDNVGCSVENTALVANINGLAVSANSTNSNCGDISGSINVIAVDGKEPYLYQLENNLPQSSAVFVVGPGIYELKVTDANGCEYVFSKQVESNTSFALDIQPIIANTCSTIGCHNGSNSLPNFNNISIVQANASMIKSRTQSGNMPKTGSLTQEEKDFIACWVDDGASDN
jgi:hypothetical protein